MQLKLPGETNWLGRVIAVRLSAGQALKNKRRAKQKARLTQRKLDPRSLEATHFVMVFTTVKRSLLSPAQTLVLYRARWQVELTFKRLKQLLEMGHLPHKDRAAALAWVNAKLVVALLMEEVLRRNAENFPLSPDAPTALAVRSTAGEVSDQRGA